MPMMMPSSYSMPMLQHNNPMERAFIDKLSTSAAAWDSKLDALLQEQESAAATQTIDDATWEREFAKHQELIANATEQINKRDQGVEQAFSEFQDVWKSADGGANFDADDDEFRSLGDDPGLDGAFHQSNSTRFQNLTYQFEAENAYLSHADPFAEGMRLVESNGSLTQAALAFEAAVQKDPQHADAWANLGRVQAENEKEEPAIAALQHAVRSNPAHSEALMALSVSYTNEGCDREAFVTLDQWLHGAYPDVHTPHDRDMEIMPINELYDHVIEGFLKAVRRDTANVDANVQVGLGILFYNSGQYDKAVDCFNTALQIRPNV